MSSIGIICLHRERIPGLGFMFSFVSYLQHTNFPRINGAARAVIVHATLAKHVVWKILRRSGYSRLFFFVWVNRLFKKLKRQYYYTSKPR